MFTRTLLLAAVCLAVVGLLAPLRESVSAQSRLRSKPAPEPPETAVDPAAVTVYLAELGNDYHRSTCKVLGKSGGISVSLAEAKKNGYARCKICKPPK